MPDTPGAGPAEGRDTRQDPARPAGDESIALTQLRLGEWGSIRDMSGCGREAETLRAMGLKPDARVRVCRCGSPCIVEVRWCDGPSCRLGLSRRLAEHVMVGRQTA